jgi:hypothetical protein
LVNIPGTDDTPGVLGKEEVAVGVEGQGAHGFAAFTQGKHRAGLEVCHAHGVAAAKLGQEAGVGAKRGALQRPREEWFCQARQPEQLGALTQSGANARAVIPFVGSLVQAQGFHEVESGGELVLFFKSEHATLNVEMNDLLSFQLGEGCGFFQGRR